MREVAESSESSKRAVPESSVPKRARDWPDLDDLAADLESRGLLHVVDEEAARHHVTRWDILGRSHSRTHARARHEVMRRYLDEFALSAPEVGKLLDRDHSTVLVGAAAARKRAPRPIAKVEAAPLAAAEVG